MLVVERLRGTGPEPLLMRRRPGGAPRRHRCGSRAWASATATRVALDRVDLEVGPGQLVSRAGAQRQRARRACCAWSPGSSRPPAGRVRFDGRDLAGVPAHERGVGLMFQDFALFPHRDVAGNVGFGLRMRGLATGGRVRARVAEVLELVGLPGREAAVA